jgi:hypothetical protein
VLTQNGSGIRDAGGIPTPHVQAVQAKICNDIRGTIDEHRYVLTNFALNPLDEPAQSLEWPARLSHLERRQTGSKRRPEDLEKVLLTKARRVRNQDKRRE